MGAVPRTGLPARQTLLSASALAARRLEERAATRVPSCDPRGRGAKWLTEHAAHPGAATREPTRSPRGRQCEYPSQGDHPQNWRAASQGPAVARYVFNTDGIFALSAHVAYVLAGVFILYYETMLHLPHQLFPALSILHQESPLRGGRRLSLLLHCCTLVFCKGARV